MSDKIKLVWSNNSPKVVLSPPNYNFPNDGILDALILKRKRECVEKGWAKPSDFGKRMTRRQLGKLIRDLAEIPIPNDVLQNGRIPKWLMYLSASIYIYAAGSEQSFLEGADGPNPWPSTYEYDDELGIGLR